MSQVDHRKIVNDELEKQGLQLTAAFNTDLNTMINAEKDFVLAMVDLDMFDSINKRFGEDIGDKVLIETGKQLVEKLCENGKCYRYGGDQFAIILNEAIEKEGALFVLEAIRSSFRVELPDKTSAEISIGIAANNDDAATASELIRKAEGAMIRAKQVGRNKVCLARDDKMVTKTTHYTAEQLHRLTKISKREGIGEAILLREALDALLKKYDV